MSIKVLKLCLLTLLLTSCGRKATQAKNIDSCILYQLQVAVRDNSATPELYQNITSTCKELYTVK